MTRYFELESQAQGWIQAQVQRGEPLADIVQDLLSLPRWAPLFAHIECFEEIGADAKAMVQDAVEEWECVA